VLARSVTLNVLGQLGSLLVGLVGSVLLARWLGPTDRGLLGAMTSVVELVMALASMGLPFAVMYFASRADPPSGPLLGNSFAYGTILAIVVVPTFWLFDGTIADMFGRGRGGETWALVGVLVPLTFLDWTTHNQLLGGLRFGLFNILAVLSKTVGLIVTILLIGVIGLGVTGGVLALAAGSLVFIVGALRVLLSGVRPRWDRALMSKMLHYGRRVQIGVLFQIANARLDVLILQFYRPLSQVGYYVVAQTIAELVLVLGRAFQSSVLPLVALYEGEQRQELTIATSLRLHGVLAIAATLANAVVGAGLILFAYGPAFHPAVLPMFILLPGMWFLSTGTVVAGVLRGRGQPGFASALAGGAVVVTVALDFVLIPALGIPGAALASLAAYVVFGISSLIALSRLSGIPLRSLLVPTREDLRLSALVAGRLMRRLGFRGLRG